MPLAKGRGPVVRVRAKKIPGDSKHYLLCEVYEKAGVRGGRTVCHKKTKKGK